MPAISFLGLLSGASIARKQAAAVALSRLSRALPAYYSTRPTLEEAKDEIRRGVEQRGETFLAVARERIYGDPSSPYLHLLRLARCEFADLAQSVRQAGLEATLERLAAEGVYLTVDEYRGNADVVRGRVAFRVTPEMFQRRDGAPGILIQTSGSTGQPIGATASLARLDFSVRPLIAFFAAHSLFDASHALVDAVLPGSGGTCCMLIYTKIGIVPKRWFARTVPNKSRAGALYHWLSTQLIVRLARTYGPGFPAPEFVDSTEILHWISEERAAGRPCCITASSSNAVRIAGQAARGGIRLDGVTFVATGEPLTEAKREIIETAGATVTCRYAFTELGMAGYGCGARRFTDELHVLQNFATVVPHSTAAYTPLLFTTIDPCADRLLLNVANGDCGIIDRSPCACALEASGLGLHLHGIRSREKFTAEGMNYFWADLAELIEKILPEEFGGASSDYQLAEEEDTAAETRLVLRIHPRVGAVDEASALGRVRRELGRGAWGNEFQARIWDNAGTLRVRREAPIASARGKILPLAVHKKPSA
ncbi:MAG TPA: hypothetical protein VGH50_04085 [Candidatus Binatia bacterium]